MSDLRDVPSPERLLHTLAAIGDVDNAVEVLDAILARNGASESLLPVQAKLFMAAPVIADEARARMASWCNGALDDLARQGFLREAAVGYCVLARVFPEERVWIERHARFESLQRPLRNPSGDPARTAVDAMLARGALAEALAALRTLRLARPDDAELAVRTETLAELLADTPDTRPYGALDPARADALTRPFDVAALTADVQRALATGDLRAALRDATTLGEHMGPDSRWGRYRAALERVIAWSLPGPAASDGDEITHRTGPVERADLWIRTGRLDQARDALRAQLASAPSPDVASALAARLADLDLVLDRTLPTPIPPRPSFTSSPSIPRERAPVATPEPEAPTDRQPSIPTPALATPSTPGPALPATPEASSATPVAGDVKVGKRKIVRLS